VVRSRVGLALLAMLLGGVLGGVLLVPRAGRFVVHDEPFAYADTAVVLSGDPIRRALAARDLYRQGRVGEILLIPEPRDRAEEELLKLGLPAPSLLAERILAASGVPPSRIAFLPGPADGTIVEAHRVREFLDGRLTARLVVITSKYASRRACFIFHRVLRDVDIICAPTPYDPFERERWWTQPRNALFVVMEYQKFLVNALTLMLGLDRA